MQNFDNKVALITGAASGIGQAIAYEFGKQGAKVAIVDISEAAEATRDYIIQGGAEALFIKADVSKTESHNTIIEIINKTYGRLDFACNNAGIEQFPTKLIDVEENTWDRIIDINLKSVWLGMRTQIPYFIKNNIPGIIVNTASVAGLQAYQDIGIYNCSKAGVTMLTKTAALEHAKQNIRINAICPGLVMTEMTVRMSEKDPEYFKSKFLDVVPMGRGASPHEIAAPALFLCSDAASFITGQCLVVDGGLLS